MGSIALVEPTGLKLVSEISPGHSATIRCCNFISDQSGTLPKSLVTGGEDARICAWELNNSHDMSQSPQNDSISGGGSGTKADHAKDIKSGLRYSPY